MKQGLAVRVTLEGRHFTESFEFEVEDEDAIRVAFDVIDQILDELNARTRRKEKNEHRD